MSTYPRTRKEQEVWQACDDLLAIGKTVKEITGEAIAVRLRELKYKAGSTTQRYQYRDSWMAARGISREDTITQASELSDPVARAAAVFKEGLERELKKEYESKYSEQQAALEDKQSEIEKLNIVITGLQNQLNKESEAHNALQERYEVQSKGYQSLHEKNIGYQTKITELEKSVTSLQGLVTNLTDKNQQQQENLSNQFDDMITELKVGYEQRISDIKVSAEKQRHRAIAEIDSLKTDNKKLVNELNEKTTELKIKSEKLSSVEKQLESQSVLSDLIKDKHQAQESFYQSLLSELQQEKNNKQTLSHMQEQLVKSQQEIQNKLMSLRAAVDSIKVHELEVVG